MTTSASLQSISKWKVVSLLVIFNLLTFISGCSDPIESHIEDLKDNDAEVRISAAAALGEIGPAAKAAVPNLIETLKDQNGRVRGSAARALGEIGPDAKAAVSSLIEALNDENSGVRADAAHALGRIGPDAKDAIPHLSKTLKDGIAAVRGLTVDALWRIAKALQMRKDTTAIPDLEMALTALKETNSSEEITDEVRRAVDALKAMEEAP